MAFLQNYYSILFLICNVAVIASQKCHVGWSYLPSTGYCYGSSAGVTTSVTWNDGENICQRFGGHLVTAESVTEFRHILSYFYVAFRNTWFAVYADDLNHGRWNSVDGTRVDFSYIRWCTGHPWTQFSGKRCIGLGYDGVSVCWFCQNCHADNNMQVVCKAPPISITAKDFTLSPQYRCKVGWSYFPPTGYCYGSKAGPSTSITWMDAENYCQSAGGHLVTPQNMVEFRHLLSYFHVAFRNTWYGVFSDSLAGGHYQSVDGTPVDFSHSRWCLNHPWKHLPGRRCIGLGYDGVSVCYFDQNCVTDNNMQLVCKAKPELIPQPLTPDFEPEANPPIPTIPVVQTEPTVPTTIATVATTRKQSCRV